ncbi:hypothetical protein ACLOJK_011419, partial [Asimina triloba]
MGNIATNNIEEVFLSGNPFKTRQTMTNCIRDKNADSCNIPLMKKTIILDVKDWDTIHDMKVRVQDKEAISRDRQIILYAGMMKKTIMLDAKDLDTIHDIKLLVLDKEPISFDQQIIIFAGMFSSHVTECKNLSVEDRTRISNEVREWYTIQDIRTAISSMWEDPEAEHVLSNNIK